MTLRRQEPEPSIAIVSETTEQTIARSKAHLGMLRSKSGDAPDHVNKAKTAIAESHQAMADADKEPLRQKPAREHAAEGDQADFDEVLRNLP